jgi:hypothetical protein
MAAFLLWNVRRSQPTDALVHALVRNHQIDVVLLVEYPFGLSQLPALLLAEGLVKRRSWDRFGVFVRTSHRFRRLPFRLGTRIDVWNWAPPSGQEGVVALLHGLDRRHYDDSTRRLFFRRVVDALHQREEKQNHRRTIIAGDFNAQPFESAMSAADGLHAIGLRSIKSAGKRKVREGGAPREFFYNPMWRLYGQPPDREAGFATYHWGSPQAHQLCWHMLDQVVLRPGEISRFPENRLEVVVQVGGVPLLDVDGLPDFRTASDHLPIIFHWDL